jgi:hypothetical protein
MDENLFNISLGQNIHDKRTKAYKKFKSSLYTVPLTRSEFVRKYGYQNYSESKYLEYLKMFNLKDKK